MKIVIDIHDKLYDLIKHYERSIEIIEEENDTLEITLMRAVINGIPLPEHHGRLIDADALQAEMDKDVRRAMSFVDLKDFVWLAPTIIEGSDSE